MCAGQALLLFPIVGPAAAAWLTDRTGGFRTGVHAWPASRPRVRLDPRPGGGFVEKSRSSIQHAPRGTPLGPGGLLGSIWEPGVDGAACQDRN